MKYHISVLIFFLLFCGKTFAQQPDSTEIKKLSKLRTESGVDPTRVQSKASYSMLIYDPVVNPGRIENKFTMNIGISRWSFTAKYNIVTKLSPAEGNGFSSGSGDFRFTVLNAFFVKGKHALAASAEFSVPTGAPGYGSQYFSLTPALTYSFTITPSLFVAIQPQYTFPLLKDPAYPNLGILTIRSFIAKFTQSGYFFVFEPRPIYDFVNKKFDVIISPIVGKALGKGFNLLYLMEIPVTTTMYENTGILYQFGINKSF